MQISDESYYVGRAEKCREFASKATILEIVEIHLAFAQHYDAKIADLRDPRGSQYRLENERRILSFGEML